MSTALVRIADATGFTRSQIELAKDTVARGATDEELMFFLTLAKRSGLDPFARQIYLIERRANVNGQWVTTRQPLTGIDGLRLIADRTERYAPGREPSFVYDNDGRLLAATAYVKKWVRGEWHEVAATAHYGEYVQSKKDGTPTSMWAEKPHIMLAKCAEALALRRSFPAEMSGVYTSDEMPQQGQGVVMVGEVVNAPQLVASGMTLPPLSRDEAVTSMRNAAKALKAAGIVVDMPTREDVEKMSLEGILALTEAWESELSPVQPAA